MKSIDPCFVQVRIAFEMLQLKPWSRFPLRYSLPSLRHPILLKFLQQSRLDQLTPPRSVVHLSARHLPCLAACPPPPAHVTVVHGALHDPAVRQVRVGRGPRVPPGHSWEVQVPAGEQIAQ